MLDDASRDALYDYSLVGRRINAELRRGFVTDIVLHIDRAFLTAPPSAAARVVWRALDSDELASIQAQGGEFLEPAFLSTTRSRSVAERMATEPVVMRILVPAGLPMIDMNVVGETAYPHEREILLPRDTRITVTGTWYERDGRLVLHATLRYP